MGLDVRVVSAKETLHTVPSQIFRLVDILTSAVVSFSGISFGILVGQGAAEGFQNGETDEILGCDELQLGILPVDLALNSPINVGVNALKVLHRHEVKRKCEVEMGSAGGIRRNGQRSVNECILFTRRSCRPPSNGVVRNVLTISTTLSHPVMRSPMVRTFASLWSRASRAAVTDSQTAARIPLCLLATIDIPIPVPHTKIPRSHSPPTIAAEALCPQSG